jgi:hypothetical protein
MEPTTYFQTGTFRKNPIVTPAWTNTVDNVPPTCQIDALASFQTNTSFSLRWSATDQDAGIESYSVYVSDNGGEYTAFLIDTTNTTATFTGETGHTYRFYCAATDGAGNVEDPDPDIAAVQTTLVTSIPLGIALSSDQVRLSWPLPGTGYVLEEVNALNASPVTGWTPVSIPYETNDTHIFITVPLPAGNKFYRLRTP